MSTITADKGYDNIYEFEVPIALVSGSDKFWFTAKRKYADADSAAVIKKGLNVTGGLTGIAVTDAGPPGKFQVILDEVDTASLDDESLLYDCKVQPSGSGRGQQVQRGVMRIRKTVTKATS